MTPKNAPLMRALCALFCICMFWQSASADVITVTTNAGDNSAGSLREAIRDANTIFAGKDTIIFGGLMNPDTVTIADSVFSLITEDLVIMGGDSITISGDRSFNILSVDNAVIDLELYGLGLIRGNSAASGAAVNHALGSGGNLIVQDCSFEENVTALNGGAISTDAVTVSISNSWFNGDTASGGASFGGAVHVNDGDLTITTSVFERNFTAHLGGAIGFVQAVGDEFTMDGCTLDSNSSANNAGAIQFESTDGTTDHTISNSSFTGNVAANNGGVFHSIPMTLNSLTVSSSTFTGNSSTTLDGGAMSVRVTAGTVVIDGCTYSQNVAGDDGGAIHGPSDGTLTIQNSTIHSNSADDGAAVWFIDFTGGAVLNVNSSTITSNTATTTGGGLVLSQVVGTTVNIDNSIIADNTDGGGAADIDDQLGAPTYGAGNDFNFIEDASGSAYAAGGNDVAGTNPDLGPLQDNGGSTFTRLPNASSPVIGVGSNAPLAADQRGTARVNPTTIGAVEAACPVASFDVDTVCANVPNTFVNTSIHPVAPGFVYRWDFENDNTDLTTGNYFNGDTLTFQYNAPGTYTAVLVIVASGCTDTFSRTVEVLDNPRPAFNVDSVVCVNDIITFTDQSAVDTPADQHNFWTFPPSTATEYPVGDVTHLFSTPGNYTVTFLVVDSISGCFADTSKNITVQDPPEAHVQLNGFTRDTISICQFDSIYFSDSTIASAAPNIHQLIFSGGQDDTTYAPQFITLFFDTVGTFDVVYIVGPDDTSCNDADSFVIVVTQAPSLANFALDTTCFPDSVNFSLDITPVAGVNIDSLYFFNQSGSVTFALTDTGQRAFVYPTAGIDTLFVQAVDENGCSSNPEVDTLVFFDTITSVSFVTDTVCAMDSIYLEIVPVGAIGVTNYAWDFDNDTIFDANTGTTANDSALYDTGGLFTFNVEITYGNGVCFDTFSGDARVVAKPVFEVTIDTVCDGTVTTADYVDATISLDPLGAADTTYYFDFDGTYPPFSVVSTDDDTAGFLFASGGRFPVAFIMEDAFGCWSDTIVDTALVLDLPTFTVTRDTSCFGDASEIIVTDTFITAVEYYYDFTGNDSVAEVTNTTSGTSDTGTFLYPTFGDSVINIWTIAQPAGCASDTFQDTIKIIEPLVVIPVLDRDTGCSNDSLIVKFEIASIDSGMAFATANWAIMFDYNTDDTTDVVAGGFAFADTLYDTTTAFAATVDTWVQYQYIPRYDDGIYNCRAVTTPPAIDTLIDSVFVFAAPDLSLAKLDTACDGDALVVSVTDLGLSTLTALKYYYNFDTAVNVDEVQATSFADTFFSVTLPSPGKYNFRAWAEDTVAGCFSDTANANELGDSFVVRELPTANFYVDGACANQLADLNDTSSFTATFLAGLDSVYWDVDTSGMALLDSARADAPFSISALLAGGINNDITYTIVDSFGCQDDTTASVFVNTPPVANFGLDSVCFGDTSFFADSSITTDSSRYTWDFDGGGFEVTDTLVLSATGGDIQHLYTTAPPVILPFQSFYTVTLIVQDSLGCSDTAVNNDAIVYAQPTINDFRTDTVCLGDSVIFFSDVNTATSISLRYDFWADTTLTVNVPTATNPNSTAAPNGYYTNPGTYVAQLVAINTNTACRVDSSIFFYQRDLPGVAVEIDTVCFGSPSTFISTTTFDSTVDQATFEWAVRNVGIAVSYDSTNVVSGLSTGSNDTITPTVPVSGAYVNSANTFLIINVTDEHGCNDSLNVDRVYIAENPDFTINTDTVCFGNPTTFDATIISTDPLTTGSTYDWFIDGSTITSFGEDTTYTYMNMMDQTDTVSLTITTATSVSGLSCVTTVGDSTVYVQLTPVANINTDTACFGSPTNFTVSGLVIEALATDTTFTWLTANEGVFSSGDSADVAYILSAFGADSAVLIISDDIGCADTFSDNTLFVNESPTATINTDTVCEGTATLFDILTFTTAPSATDTIFQWSTANEGIISFSDTIDLSYVLSSPGQDTATLTITDDIGCSFTISDSTVYVYLTPTATINTDTVCSGTPTTFDMLTLTVDPAATDTTVQWWTLNEGQFSSSQDTMYTLATPGADTALFVVLDDLGCTDTIFDFTLYTNISPTLTAINTDTVCEGSPTTFTAVSFTVDAGASDTTFTWSTLVDGIYATDANPLSQVVGAAGADSATLVITDNAGCSDTLGDGTLYVLTAPTAVINTDTVCEGNATFFELISFTTDPLATDTVFNWSTLNEGLISSADTANVLYVLSTPGADIATLSIDDGNGCNVGPDDSTLYMVALPTATINTDTVCFGDATSFDLVSYTLDPASADTTFQWWTLNEGQFSGAEDTTFVLANAGGDTALLVIVDEFGCTDTFADFSLYVYELPTATIATDTACFGQVPNSFTVVTYTVDPASADTTFEWTLNAEGLISSADTADVFYLKGIAGADTATLVISDDLGCADTVIDNEVYTAIVPTISYLTSDTVCFRDSNTFAYEIIHDAEAVSDSLIWQFNFPTFTDTLVEGNTLVSDTLVDTTRYSYPNPGQYQVQLFALDNFGCLAAFGPVNAGVDSSPTADFTADTACLGSPTFFTLSGNNQPVFNFIYLWDFENDGFNDVSVPSNTNYTYPTAGVDTAKLTVISTVNGCADSAFVAVLVDDIPDATFNFNTNCPGDSSEFFALADSGVSYHWDFEAPSTSDTLLSFDPLVRWLYLTSGLRQVELTVTDTLTGCAGTNIQPVNVGPNVAANFTVDNDSICQGDDVTFTPSFIPATASVSWDFEGDGMGDDTTNGTVTNTYTADGSFNATFIVDDNAGCIDSSSRVITVFQTPVASISSDIVCVGDTNTISDLSTGNNLVYSWDLDGDGTVDNTTAGDQQVFSPTVDSVTVILQLVDTDFGCNSTDTTIAVVTNGVATSFTAPSALCEDGSPIILTGSPSTAFFTVNGVGTNVLDPSLFNAGDVVTVVLDDTSVTNCAAQSSSALVTIGALPTITLSVVDTSVTINYPVMVVASGAETYVWSTPTQIVTESANGDTVVYLPAFATNVYTVVGTDSNGCEGTAAVRMTQVENQAVRPDNAFSPNGDGINDIWNIGNILAYPEARVRVYTRWGEVIYDLEGYVKPFDGRYLSEDLPVGTYYYVIDLNDGQPPISGYVDLKR